LTRLLEPFRSCFTAPTFDTFVVLVAGLIAQTGVRTVCGMLAGAGMARAWHHCRAHRFFAAARWDVDQVGLVVLRLIIGWLVPVGAPLVIAIDDTMFRRWGRRVHAAHWGYDGSLRVPRGGKNKKLSRGNCFVVAAVVVELPFLDRPVALPVLARLWRKGGPTKAMLAHDLIDKLRAATAGRTLHVVADGTYVCHELRDLPRQVTLTGPMPRHAGLWHVHPELDQPPPGARGRGRPRVFGDKIGTPDRLRVSTPGRRVRVSRYGRTATVTAYEQRCLWRGVFGSRPVRAILITEPGHPTLALVTTDRATALDALIHRYASRWAIEVCFSEAKNTTGVGQARNRGRRAVERTVPFGFLTQSIVIIWYHLAGHRPAVVTDRRRRAPWYTTKAAPSTRRHARQAAAGLDRRPISARGGPPAHPRRNPGRAPGLGAGRRMIAKVEGGHAREFSRTCFRIPGPFG
jgi:hypothetical protein